MAAASRLNKLRELQHGEAWTSPRPSEICSGCGVMHAAKPANEQLC
jgi:hypothetical protein